MTRYQKFIANDIIKYKQEIKDEEIYKMMQNLFNFDREFKISETWKFDISILMRNNKEENIMKIESTF